MKKLIGILSIVAVMVFGGSHNLMAACGSLEDQSLRLVLPCIEYAGQHYEVAFDHYPNPSDPSGLYWRFSTLWASSSSGSCGSVDANLNITGACVNYFGIQYTFSLDYYNNPSDPSGLYWKLKLATLDQLPGSIASVSGGDSVCYPEMEMDPSQIAAISQCLVSCADDVSCISGCLGMLNLPGTFPLGLTLNNPTAAPIEYSIPAGFVFSPESSDVQPMLVLQDLILTVDPGSSTYCLPTYCLDVSLSAPGEEDDYTAGPLASQQCLQDIINYTRGKDVTTQAFKIQDIIWDCMENGSISNEDRAFLEAL